MPIDINKFGEPLLTRKSDISGKVASTKTQFPLEVMGRYQPLKQIRVRIGLPVYRIENGRTRTFQKEYLVKHPDKPADLFITDTDSIAAQRAQHEILQWLAEDEDLYSEFENGTQQTEPIIITSTGVVVNGNRRLCVWRTLYNKDPEKYKHFEFIEAAVLPEDCDEAEVRALEKRLQIQKTHRAEYKWHNKAAMLREEREKGATIDSLAKSYDISKKDVDLLIGALEYADIYLQKIGKTDQWSIVDGDEFAFKAIVDERKKINDQGRKELFEAVCFKLIENKDYQGRLWSIIPEIAEHLDAIAAGLQEKGLLPTPDTVEKPSSGSQDAEQSNEDIDLLGGDEIEKDSYSDLASVVQAAPVKLGGLVKQITDEQNAIRNERKNSKYLIKSLSAVSRTLWNIRMNSLNENTALEGAQAQIDSIKENLLAIEQWIIDHQIN